MKTALHVEDAPKAIGPYSQAQVVRLHGGQKLVYTSGQIAIDARNGQLIDGGVKEQTKRVVENLRAVLAGAGLTLADVVKTTVYLVDMQDFADMNEVYATFFPKDPPARATVQVAALPKGAKVEIDAVATR